MPDVQPMLSDIEIYQSANALIRRYGDGAAVHAAMRADEGMQQPAKQDYQISLV